MSRRLDLHALLATSREGRGDDECWPWAGRINRTTGYGTAGAEGYAHRWVYATHVAPIPEGMTIDHVGHNFAGRCCVNWHHMEVVTRTVNSMRGGSPIANNARKTHCPQGHPLAGDNLIVRVRQDRAPTRECRTCKRASENRRYHLRMGHGR